MKANQSINLLCAIFLIIASSCERNADEPLEKANQTALTTLAGGEDLQTYAGSIRGSKDRPLLEAQFDCPKFLCAGPNKSLYVYDSGFTFESQTANYENRKIRIINKAGVVSTFYTLTANESGIAGMAPDKDGSVYISQGRQIKKISADGKLVTLIAGTQEGLSMKDGPALEASFNQPRGLALNKAGCLYIIDGGYNALRRLTNNTVSTLAGGNDFPQYPFPGQLPKDGLGKQAEFDFPEFISLDKDENIYVSGGLLPIIRKVTPNGQVSTINIISSDYDSDYYLTYTAAAFGKDGSMYANFNSAVGFKQTFYFRVSKILPGNTYLTLAENSYRLEFTNGIFTPSNGLLFPTGLAVIDDDLYIANTLEHKIRKLHLN